VAAGGKFDNEQAAGRTVIYDGWLRQMPSTEKLTPVAAAVTALSTLVCCLPTGFAAAAATTSVGLFVTSYQQWFLAASVLLLGVGAVQLRSARRTCSTTRSSSVVVLCVSAVIVLITVLFPQLLAVFIADWLG
jgi:hypothetical protein